MRFLLPSLGSRGIPAAAVLLAVTLMFGAHMLLQAWRQVPPPAASPSITSLARVQQAATGVDNRNKLLNQSVVPQPSIVLRPPPPRSVMKQHVWMEPRWMVKGERQKAGAGLLFFAYGPEPAWTRLILLTQRAAKSFRTHNPGISIAVVSNAPSSRVDREVFDTHIVPRGDMLFAGNAQQEPGLEGKLTQRLTRLYYLAHSPYELTWALDPDVVSCTPHVAANFLQEALEHKLWGFHMVQTSASLSKMDPLTSNLVFLWREETSALLRDWFMLQLREGVDADDRKALHFAEQRMIMKRGRKNHNGQLIPELSAQFVALGNGTRATPLLRGAVHVIHSPDPSMCDVFNEHATQARVLVSSASHPTPVIITSQSNCTRLLGVGSNACFFPRPPSSSSVPPTTHVPKGATKSGMSPSWNSSTDPSGALMNDAQIPPLPPMQPPPRLMEALVPTYVLPFSLEPLSAFRRRCGDLCADDEADGGQATLRRMRSATSYTMQSPCRLYAGARLGEVAKDAISCPSHSLLRSFKLTSAGCTTRGKLRFVYACSRFNAVEAETRKVARASGCIASDGGRRIATIDRFADLGNIACPDGSALAALDRCDAFCDAGGLHLDYVCNAMAGYALPDGFQNLTSSVGAGRARKVWTPPLQSKLPLREPYNSETLCTPMVGLDFSALEAHPVTCGGYHALGAFRLTSEGCGEGEMHFKFRCTPLQMHSASHPVEKRDLRILLHDLGRLP